MAKLDITHERTIWCYRCSHWEQRTSKSTRSFTRAARKQGWCIREGKTVCPECRDALAKGGTMEEPVASKQNS